MEAEISEPQAIRTLQLVFSSLRKIGEDIIVVIDNEKFSLRTLNATRSALPVIIFRPAYFKSFKYYLTKEQFVAQIPAASFIMAFKNAQNPTSLKFLISEEEDHLFTIALVDKYTITHTWDFPLSDSQLWNAMFDLNETSAEVKCRFDVFDGLSEAFKKVNTIYLEMHQGDKKGALYFKSCSTDDTNGALSSTLIIHKSERCDIQISEDVTTIQIAFSLADFIVGVKIAKLLSQFFTIHIIGPGQPLILKASSTNLVQFDMPLATITDNDEEAEDQENNADVKNEFSQINSFNNNYVNNNNDNDNDSNISSNNIIINNSEMSQVSNWPRGANRTSQGNASVKENTSFGGTPTIYDLDRKPKKNSQTLAQELYAESPQFPAKRRFVGPNTIAQASQQPSDDEEAD